MIYLQNRQRTVQVDTKSLKKKLEKILDHLGYSQFDLTVRFVSDKKMQEYNAQFRGKDKPTNVLAFPFYPNAKPGEKIVVTHQDEQVLGDIVIAPHYVVKEATASGESFAERLEMLLIHGLCHLLGYDHIKEADYKKMHKFEKSLIKLVQ